MVNETYLDELVDFPEIVILRLLNNQNVVDLLSNIKNATLDDMEDDDGKWKYFYDYEHIPETIQEIKSAFCIDTDIVSVPNKSTKRLELYVSCYCSQANMSINTRVFTGFAGNRLNNLLRYADLSLRSNMPLNNKIFGSNPSQYIRDIFDFGNRVFGIGKLELKNVRTVTSGNTAFAKKMLTYSIPDFNTNRVAINV
ncbi:hypothetical protein SDC9_41242 [bioreactor metagenome]|uniref:Uncharacterized protein n=1 Tax=bioreactor metagenome TaxID=1076179 RepID=A0A644VUJ5_9ZZZZ